MKTIFQFTTCLLVTLLSLQYLVAQETYLKATSYGLALPKDNVTLRPNIDSHVRKVHVIEGQRVKKGDILVELDWEIARAKKKIAELSASERGAKLRAESELAFAKSSYQRFKRLSKTKAVNQREFEEAALRLETAAAQLQTAAETMSINLARLELAEAELNEYFIEAPFDGEVVLVGISEGSVVNSNTDLVKLIASDTLNVDLYLPIKHALQLEKGSVCQLKVREPFPGEVVEAKMTFRSPIIEATTAGSVRVAFEIDNRELKLPAGFAVELWSDPAKMAEEGFKSVKFRKPQSPPLSTDN